MCWAAAPVFGTPRQLPDLFGLGNGSGLRQPPRALQPPAVPPNALARTPTSSSGNTRSRGRRQHQHQDHELPPAHLNAQAHHHAFPNHQGKTGDIDYTGPPRMPRHRSVSTCAHLHPGCVVQVKGEASTSMLQTSRSATCTVSCPHGPCSVKPLYPAVLQSLGMIVRAKTPRLDHPPPPHVSVVSPHPALCLCVCLVCV